MQLPIGLLAAAVLTTSSAIAGVSIPGTGALSATDAVSLSLQRGGGSGHVSIVPYSSTQRGNSTLINMVNSDVFYAKAIKVRFRSAGNGATVFGFTLFLAPMDTWAINVSSDGVGGRSFATVTDVSCTLPANLNDSQKADWTRESLVEFITMAMTLPGR